MKKMKNFRFYAILMLNIWLFGACELDRFPETDLSDASFWGSEDNFKKACNVFYISIDGQAIFFDDLRTDFGYNTPNGANDVSSGTRITPATSSDWDANYQIIFDANNIIENAVGKEDIESIERWIGEAKFFRAYAYFDLISKFGDVPLVLNVLDVDSPELNNPRVGRESVIDQIYEDLDYAAANVPSIAELPTTDYGRVSKNAALTFKARVALYEGTRQKFHDYGDFSSNLNIAINAAEKAMAEENELYTEKSYFYIFQEDGEGVANKENIFSVVYGVNDSQTIRSHNITGLIQNGWYCVTRPMVELYLCTDGLPIDKSPLAEDPEISYMSIFKNKDPRMDFSLFKEGDPSNNPDIWDPNVKQNVVTGFSARKFYNPNNWQRGSSYIDIPVIRYAEVLLIYAEAKFEMDGSISDLDLDKSINLLRDRVGMPHLTNSFVLSNGLDMRTEIRRERSVELAQEGFRYNDIIRWKIAEVVLPNEMVGANYFTEMGPRNVSSDGYLLAQPASTRSFDSSKDYLYPIPTREISLSGNAIIQNPGW